MTRSAQARELLRLAGGPLGVSEWIEIDQARVTAFADATRDHQWLHVDDSRAEIGPYGTTIAHGLLTLSLIPSFMAEVLTVEGARAVINYGYDRIRFPHPVRVGEKLRDRVVLDAADVSDTGIRLTVTHTIEIDGRDKPACVATGLTLIRVDS